MTFDEISLTYFLIIPYISVCLYFYIYKRDNFFLKIRASIQLLLILILLGLSFIDIMLWKALFEKYTFLNFDIQNKDNQFKTTALVTALAAIAAVFGWIFTSRVQIINTIRSHSVQVLMNSRNSTVYMAKVDEATKIRRKLQDRGLTSLSAEEFRKLEHEEKSAVSYLLNFLEFVAIGIRHNNLDEDLIRGSFKTILKSNYVLFSPVIGYLRTVDGEKIYDQLELLHKRWELTSSEEAKYCKCENWHNRIVKYFQSQPRWLLHFVFTIVTGTVWLFLLLIMKTVERLTVNKENNYICEMCSVKDKQV